MKQYSIIVVRNAVGCFLCGGVAESKSIHDFQTCPCGNVSADGGLAYIRRGVMNPINPKTGYASYMDLSETIMQEMTVSGNPADDYVYFE